MDAQDITTPELYTVEGPLFIPIGAGEAEQHGVGGKAARLDTAAAAGLRVPAGYILLDDFWQVTTRNGIVDVQDDQVVCDNPANLLTALGLPEFEKKTMIAVRSAFSVEDQPSGSMAGYFDSVLNIDVTKKPEDFVDALCQVWSSSLKYGDEVRRDVLVMVMVDAQFAGVAFTETNYEDDYVNFTKGTAEKLLAGEEEGNTRFVRKLRPYERGDREEGTARASAEWHDRLQVLMRRLRRLFGERAWDVEWADDGIHCYLLQIRPVTRAVRRNEAFTLANHKEILPALPSRYMVSVIQSCSEDLYAYYRQFDSSLPGTRPFIEVFKGRPYINLSLMTETMRALGLPTTLVTNNIGGEEDEREGLRLVRAVAKLPSLAQLGVEQLNAADRAQKTGAEILERSLKPGTTFRALNDTMRWTYTKLVHEMFALTQAMSLPLQVMRRADTLAKFAAGNRTISTQIYDDLQPLREYASDKPDIMRALEAGTLPDDPEFKRRWGLYLAKFGHRGIYESDIARPRFREAPGPLLVAIAKGTNRQPGADPKPTPMVRMTRPAWNQAKRAITAREQLRHDTMLAFERIRSRLLSLADEAVTDGRLPDRDAIWVLDYDELALLDLDWSPPENFFEERRAEVEALAAYNMPDLLHRFDDLENYNPKADPNAKRFTGMSLTDGEVEGRAWVLNEPATALPEDYNPKRTILVARSVDSGWIPTFSMVAGVVVETGGDLSHGSIILRELGIPAITNVSNATHNINDGDTLTLKAGSGTVTKA